MDEYAKKTVIGDVANTERHVLVFVYSFGYCIFLIRLIISILIMFVLTLLIRIMLAIIFDVFETGSGSNNVIKKAFVEHISWILSVMSSPIAPLIVLIILPIFIIVFMFAYCYYYDQKNILDTEDDVSKISKIMMTYHNFIIFLLSSLITIGFCLIIYQWFVKAYK